MSYYFEGYDGFSLKMECPYRKHTFARTLWLRGWEAAASVVYG